MNTNLKILIEELIFEINQLEEVKHSPYETAFGIGRISKIKDELVLVMGGDGDEF